MTVLGFDFGTTNSLISVIRGQEPITFLDEGRPIPSVVCYQGPKTIAGREARKRLAKSGLGIHGNIVRSPKSLLGRDSVFIEGIERSPIRIVADIVSHVLKEAKSSVRGQDLGDTPTAVVTIPVDRPGKWRRALREAFRMAGLQIVQFVHEPLAALYGHFRNRGLEAMFRRYDGKLILVSDWGGGTLDLTLCRPLDDMVVQLANDGTEEVGGDVFDESVMNHLVQQVYASRGLEEAAETQPGARERLWDLCERAKIDLSTRLSAEIYVGSYFRGVSDEDFGYTLTRVELEKVVGPLLDKGFQRINRLLENGGYAPEQVALCVATGGMSNMPAVKRRLNELFGPARVEIPDGTATLIAEGAAWIASDQAGLRLAKDVELVLARDSYLPLVKAGTTMPRGGEVQAHREPFHLYCTDPRDGAAKFQLCTPKRAGHPVLSGEPRSNLELLTVKVDIRARPFSERLELDVKINEDLILEARVRSLIANDLDSAEVHNLEFGLAFPSARPSERSRKESGVAKKPVQNTLPRSLSIRANVADMQKKALVSGELRIRANVSDKENSALVPGELLHSYDPGYFNVSRHPPEVQEYEKTYYEVCAGCRLPNPECDC